MRDDQISYPSNEIISLKRRISVHLSWGQLRQSGDERKCISLDSFALDSALCCTCANAKTQENQWNRASDELNDWRDAVEKKDQSRESNRTALSPSLYSFLIFLPFAPSFTSNGCLVIGKYSIEHSWSKHTRDRWWTRRQSFVATTNDLEKLESLVSQRREGNCENRFVEYQWHSSMV